MNFFKLLWFKFKEWRAWSEEYDLVRAKAAQVDPALFSHDAGVRRRQEIRGEHAQGRLSADEVESAIRQGQKDSSRLPLWG